MLSHDNIVYFHSSNLILYHDVLFLGVYMWTNALIEQKHPMKYDLIPYFTPTMITINIQVQSL